MQRAWDEIEDMHLDGEGDPADADAAFQRKRPDAWAVSWDKRSLLILEFTRPNDLCALSLQGTDTYKIVRYTPLRSRLAGLLPGWEVVILTVTFTIGIRGSYDPNRWSTNLSRFGLTDAQMEQLMQALVSQTLRLTELTDLYNTRYAALQNAQN